MTRRRATEHTHGRTIQTAVPQHFPSCGSSRTDRRRPVIIWNAAVPYHALMTVSEEEERTAVSSTTNGCQEEGLVFPSSYWALTKS